MDNWVRIAERLDVNLTTAGLFIRDAEDAVFIGVRDLRPFVNWLINEDWDSSE